MAVRKTGKLRTKGKARGKGRKAADVTLVDTVHQIWLAGMGALARAQKEGPKTFEKLIVDGAEYLDRGRSNAEAMLGQAIATAQETVGARMAATKDTAAETWHNLEQLFQGRVERVLHQTGIPTATEIRSLTKRIDHLSAHVEALARSKAPAKKTARRRTAKPAGG